MQMIDFIDACCKEVEFKDIIMRESENLIIQVALNLMKLQESEAEMIIQNPSEYISFTLDCCDKQESNVPKTQACKLLESVCDNIDGSLTQIAKFLCSVLNIALNGPSNAKVYLDVAKYQQEAFLLSDPILIADVCLLSLTNISYVLTSRQDLIFILNETISSNVENLLVRRAIEPSMNDIEKAKTVVLRNRFSLLMGYYADMILKDSADSFFKTLVFLIDSIMLTEGVEEVVGRGCIDTLSIVVTDKDVVPRFVDHLDVICTSLVKLILSSRYINFFEFLGDFIREFALHLKGEKI